MIVFEVDFLYNIVVRYISYMLILFELEIKNLYMYDDDNIKNMYMYRIVSIYIY